MEAQPPPVGMVRSLRKENAMDVFNVGSGSAPKAPEGGQVERKEAAGRPEGGRKTASSVTDSYAASSGPQKVRSLVDRLIAGPEGDIRTDLVEQFRALLQVGELDTPEQAQQAAEALLRGDA